ncbi:hypothetical protein [Ancylomarina longa]|uniref:HEAT repeat domain-containing protein n=1 Tax=Ancylomarina longa TaxID=2487017 RepID=A0A434AUR3_9BACT|nr:hypothetical protein [Ancylomarina longa]RUT78201.1 hypothetical protein DLK05_08965 [Ancylomarina longa]
MSVNKNDYSYLDQLTLQPEKWDDLNKNEVQVMVFRACYLYGESRNKHMISALFQLYEYLQSHSTSMERTKMLTALSATIRKKNPRAIMALFPFIQVEEDGEVIRTASQFFVNLSVLSNKEYQSGANILIELIQDAPKDSKSAYIILGLLDVDNKKIKQHLRLLKNNLGSEVLGILYNNGIQLQ